VPEAKQRIVTFDIWDTCIARATGSPESIFHAAARYVLPGASEHEIATLAGQRDAAEDEARKNVENRECTLAEIEVALAHTVGPNLAANYIAAELRLERASARPNVAIRTEVAKARASGSIVAFISDMYLPSTFLRTLLEDHGFALPTDTVFVSCEHRANKHSGKMYEIVRRTLAIESRHWTHIGDNSGSDIVIARRFGAKTIEVRASDWTPAEKRVLESARRHSERIAGAMRATRLAADPAIETGRAAFLSGVAAPWLVALATRTLAIARQEGRRRIYFVARDGEIPLRIAWIFAPEGIECRYLLGSRKAWCFPAMFDFSPPCTSWLRLAPMRPDTLLASLGFPESERDPILSRCGFDGEGRKRRLSQEELAPIWSDIATNGLESTVLRRASDARVACVEFLRTEGLFEDVAWTIADVGWSLHGQAALKRILADAGAPREPHGIYFMVRQDCRPQSETGPARAWIVGDGKHGLHSPGEFLSSMSPVIEECLLTSPDSSVAGYRGESGIVTALRSESRPAREAVRHAIELRSFAEALAREVSDQARDPEFVADLESCALDGLIHFLREPMAHEVSALRGLQHSTAPGAQANDSQPLVRPYSLGDAMALILRRAGLRRSGPLHEPYWHSGSMAVSAGLARASMKAALAPNPLRRMLRTLG
jgi:FMN phosphatase YigB (HAD superfamily)